MTGATGDQSFDHRLILTSFTAMSCEERGACADDVIVMTLTGTAVTTRQTDTSIDTCKITTIIIIIIIIMIIIIIIIMITTTTTTTTIIAQ